MVFELTLPFSSAQSIRVSENKKVWEWNFVKFSKIYQILNQNHPVGSKCTVHNGDILFNFRKKQQTIKSCESVLFCNLLR